MNDKMNYQQRYIVEDNTYPKLLKAGAGTGKTYVLLEKILNILNSDEESSLEKFAVITFTNKTADEMKLRLMTALYKEWLKTKDKHLRKQLEAYNMFNISTIHSYCEKLLREYGIIKNISPNFRIKSDRKERINIITKYVNLYSDNLLFSGIPQYKLVNLISAIISTAQNKGISINEDFELRFEFETMSNEYFNKFKRFLIKACSCAVQEINKSKLENNIVSVSNLIPLSCSVFRDSIAAERISNKYEYVFIDEVKDTNLEQFVLIRYMIGAGIKVFMIGNEKQSIYEFRGADVKNINRIEDLVGKTSNNELLINYRTDKRLLDQINDIFSCQFNYEDERLNFPFQNLVAQKTEVDIIASQLRRNSYSKSFKIKRQSKVNVECGLDATIAILELFEHNDIFVKRGR